jgi:hypothetical protein
MKSTILDHLQWCWRNGLCLVQWESEPSNIIGLTRFEILLRGDYTVALAAEVNAEESTILGEALRANKFHHMMP